MFSKLQVKFILIITFTLACTVGGGGLFVRSIFEQRLVEAMTAKAFVTGQTLQLQLERLLKLGMPLEDLTGFEDQCREIVGNYKDISNALVVNLNGEIMFQSGTSEQKKQMDIREILECLKNGKNTVVQYTKGKGKYYGFILPVYDVKISHVGAIVLELSAGSVSPKFIGIDRLIDLFPIISFLISVLFMSFHIYMVIIKPLKKLELAANSIGEKGTEIFHEVDILSNDEIGRLTASFNKMAFELQRTTVSKAYVDNIISSMLDSLIVIDRDGIIKTVNKAANVLFRYSQEEMLGKPIDDIFSDQEEVPFVGEILDGLLKTGELRNYETMFCTKSGEKIPVLTSCSVMKDDNDYVKYIVFISKNITERKRAEELLKLQAEKLVRSNAELQEFAYVASHDLQEPLRKISAFGNRLKEKYSIMLEGQGLDYITRMSNAAVRMQTLINDLLTYSRVNTKERSFASVQLQKIAEEVVSDLEIKIEQTGAHVDIGDLPVIDAEPTQMRQLFQNMIGNALKFKRPEVAPVIKVYSQTIKNEKDRLHWQTEAKHFCEITFEDNGIGIEEKYFNRIFGVFQRLHGREEYEGNGVGLSVCHKIVERHNGSISLESKSGEGTKFIIKLPLNQVQREEVYNE